MSLFTPDELKTWEDRRANTKKRYRAREVKYAAIEAIETAFNIARGQKIRATPLPFLEGLILEVGTRGAIPLEVSTWYDEAGGKEWTDLLTEHNTPETRRALWTLLKAISECPKSWARSAMTRHLKGTGKQKATNYTGNGCFGARSGWKGREIDAVMIGLTDTGYHGNPIASTLIYVPPEFNEYPGEDLWEQADNPFAAHQEERDTEFLEVLCNTLEAMGMASEMVRPGPKPAPKPRKPKTFKPGDKVTKGNARDLPTGAHLEFTVSWEPRKGQTYEAILLGRTKEGFACIRKQRWDHKKKRWEWTPWQDTPTAGELAGAKFLGVFTGVLPWKT